LSGEHLTTTIENGIAILTMDDGRANALGHAMIGALHAALDRAEKEQRLSSSSAAKTASVPVSTWM
jgi:enoyl-CoA hydratase